MSGNPFDFTDRDYASLKRQLVDYIKWRVPGWTADPSDFTMSIIEAMAWMGDMMSYYVDRAAQESNIFSAKNPNTIYQLARLYGYSPGLAESAILTVILTNKGTADVTIPAGIRVGSSTGNIGYEIGHTDLLKPNETRQYLVREGVTKSSVLGICAGFAHQEFHLEDEGLDIADIALVLEDPVTHAKSKWAYTELLLDDSPSGEVFTVVPDIVEGGYKIILGDGMFGAVPPAGWTATLLYRSCSGASGNDAGGTVDQFLISWEDPALSDLANVTVAMSGAPYGGRNEEGPESTRQSVLNLMKSQGRVVTARDYEYVARANFSVLDAKCKSEVWSRPHVWIIPVHKHVYETSNKTPTDSAVSNLASTLPGLCMAGVTPTVSLGTPLYFKAEITVRSPATVDANYVIERVQNAVFEAFKYDKARFDERVTTDDISRSIRNVVPDSLVSTVHVTGLKMSKSFADCSYPLVAGDWINPTNSFEIIPKPSEFMVLLDPKDVTVRVETYSAPTGRPRF